MIIRGIIPLLTGGVLGGRDKQDVSPEIKHARRTLRIIVLFTIAITAIVYFLFAIQNDLNFGFIAMFAAFVGAVIVFIELLVGSAIISSKYRKEEQARKNGAATNNNQAPINNGSESTIDPKMLQ